MNCYEAIDVMGDEIEGRLPPTLCFGFAAHMVECAPCATYREHLRLTRRALHELPREGGTSPRRDVLLAEFRREFGGSADG